MLASEIAKNIGNLADSEDLVIGDDVELCTCAAECIRDLLAVAEAVKLDLAAREERDIRRAQAEVNAAMNTCRMKGWLQ